MPYAKYVEYGNRPNGTGEWIYPKKGKALRFVIEGRVMFRRRVRSHGPLPFMGNAQKLVVSFAPQLASDLQRLIDKSRNT